MQNENDIDEVVERYKSLFEQNSFQSVVNKKLPNDGDDIETICEEGMNNYNNIKADLRKLHERFSAASQN